MTRIWTTSKRFDFGKVFGRFLPRAVAGGVLSASLEPLARLGSLAVFSDWDSVVPPPRRRAVTKQSGQDGQRNAMRSDHDVSPFVDQAGHRGSRACRGMEQPQRGRVMRLDKVWEMANRVSGIAWRVALPQDVIVADFSRAQANRRLRKCTGG